MTEDPNRVVVLTTVPTEAEAAAIVAALDGGGIQAQTTGELTSSSWALGPGEVRVLVREADLEQARELLHGLETGSE